MKRPLGLAELFALQTVSDPQFSPDGQWVAYVATAADLEHNVYNSNVGLVPAEGVSPSGSPTAPNGTTPPLVSGRSGIAFISGRGEGDLALPDPLPLAEGRKADPGQTG